MVVTTLATLYVVAVHVIKIIVVVVFVEVFVKA